LIELLLFRRMRKNKSLTVRLEGQNRFSKLLSLLVFSSLFVVWPCFGEHTEDLKTSNNKILLNEMWSITAKDWTKGLLKLDYEIGSKTNKLIDPEFDNFKMPKYGKFNNGDNLNVYCVTPLLNVTYTGVQSVSLDAYSATDNVSGTAQLYPTFLASRNNDHRISVKRISTNTYEGALSDHMSTIASTTPVGRLKGNKVNFSVASLIKFDSAQPTYQYSIKNKQRRIIYTTRNIHLSL